METFHIRFAVESDLEAMLKIYTPYVENTIISFETVPPTLEEFKNRFESRNGKLPWLVAQTDGGKIIGYAYASVFGERAAFAWSAESSVYIDHSVQRSGAGSRLYKALIQILQLQGYCSLYAIVATNTSASAAFHKKEGFVLQGIIPNVGFKLNEFIPLAYYYKPLTLRRPTKPPIPVSYLTPATLMLILQNC